MLRRTLLLGAAMLLAGCAANPTQAPAGSGTLAADYVKGSIKSVVMLPVLHASKAAVYQPALQSELTLALQVKNKDLRFMATNEALTRLMTGDAAGQSRSVASAVFEQTPINAAELKKLHDVLDIDAAIVCGYQTAGGEAVEMPVYILDMRSGKIVWSGVSRGWVAPQKGQGRFDASLDNSMRAGLTDLHAIMPAL